ncbi:hypothetical protein Q4534_02345 [Cyclobacterium sp. 1_MG-2023]|uniref:hypothetical protein n=1 Tax=Cyclobacterium sp. 1_MG-2023 TaxID=3062681 RepID=UPI0026E27968|nr:hypothetical protein [Cyclobacterium sp. 1_MG-2023]MDO6436225.1 hypothetical protein [Cyclobacterium sp. 1_MG-2023]
MNISANNWKVIAFAYLFTFIDYNYFLKPIFYLEFIEFFVSYGLMMFKFFSLVIATKSVDDFLNSGVESDEKSISLSFAFFMVGIGFIYMVTDFSTVSYNMIIILSLPWFLFFQELDSKIKD